MLLSIWLFGGVVLLAGALGIAIAVTRAEQRARRTLFQTLGLDDTTIDLLLARNGDVLAELTLIRRHAPDHIAALTPAHREPAATRPKPDIRLVHPGEEPSPAATPAEPVRPAGGDRRRLRLPGRS